MASDYHFIDFGPNELEVTLTELPKGCVLCKAVAVQGTDRSRAGDRLLRVKGQQAMVVMEVDPTGVAVFKNILEFGQSLLPITFRWEIKGAEDSHPRKAKKLKLEPNTWLATLELQLYMQTAVFHEGGIHWRISFVHVN
jgi:hypothetical protein